MSLATKYRPKTFDDVCGQTSIAKILTRQVELDKICNAYLFCGASGCGKTTIARIFANMLNNNIGIPIEIDGASNNGVDNVKQIIASAGERSLDSKYKIFILDECVTGDTEVLTNEGWKRFDSLTKNEFVAQYNNGKIEFVKPNEFIEKDYKGEMYNVHIGNKATFTMSPHHIQPLCYKRSKQIKESYVKDIKFAQSNRFIRSGEGTGELAHLSNLDRIAIMLQADGCLHYIAQNYNYWTIQVNTEFKKERLVSLLKDSNLDYKQLHTDRDGLIRFSVKTPCDITKKLSSHFNLNDMSSVFADEFIDELMLWDGCMSNKYLYYSCTDKDNVDFSQCVSLLCNYKSRVSSQVDNRSENYNTVYRLYLEKASMGSPNSYVDKQVIDFEGKIYCVKVPSHMILIRKDGYELVTGNCHMLTTQAWNALLKCIEEPPKYTVFIFCTTDPQKIPSTILNRVMRFNFTRLSSDLIEKRLNYIASCEGFLNYTDTTNYISRICNGEMRQGIALLEKVSAYDIDLNLHNAMESLGNYSYQIYIELLNAIIDGKDDTVLKVVNDVYNTGNDLKVFVNQLLTFTLDVNKYLLFKDLKTTKLPKSIEDEVKNLISIDNPNNYYFYLVKKFLELKNLIKNDVDAKSTVEVILLSASRCM